MNIWIFLWLILTVIILGATFWSTIILYRQKAAWERFARIHKMTYLRGKLMESPTVEGMIGACKISLFTAMRQGENDRKNRMVSVIEIALPHGMIDGGAAGTPEMVPFMQSLETIKPMEVSHEKWQENYTFMGRNQDALKLYLTPERLEALAHILVLKNADILVMFDGNQAVIRVETVDPMLVPQKLDKIITRLIADGEKLAVDEEEFKQIESKAVPDEAKSETDEEEKSAPKEDLEEEDVEEKEEASSEQTPQA